jgi:GDP-mannose 6-dehydrogenase
MGYVGVVSAACLLRDGHQITGVDPVAAKVADLAQGRSPIQEPAVADLLAKGCQAGHLKATTEASEAPLRGEMVWICVGTPSSPDGTIDLSSVEAVIKQIGRVLAGSTDRPLIVVRSTCLPGTTGNRIIPLLERESGLTVGKDLNVVFHPEFLREGTAVDDFVNPPKIVIGESRPGAGDVLAEVYRNYPARIFRLALAEAEMVKYYDNLFHALKMTFANEVATVAKSVGVDARKIAEVFCADTRLNISSHYLRPGPAFGGSCLPKDLRAILRFAAVNSLRLPVLESVLTSNDAQIKNLVARILSYQPRTVGMVGLAFKTNTDDMRESPYVKVAKELIGEGIKLKIYDPVVQPARLIGSNKQQVQKALRHLEELLVSSLDDLSTADLIVVNHAIMDADRIHSWLAAGIRVLDLADIRGVDPQTSGYEGIYW